MITTPKPEQTTESQWLALNEKLDEWFTHHPPTGPEQIVRYQAIRAAARAFAGVIVANTPYSADQSVALRHVRDAMMTANAAIACGGR